MLALLLVGAPAFAQDPPQTPLSPAAQRASQLLKEGDRAAACQEAQRAAQEAPGDSRVVGLVKLACDKGQGAFVFKTTGTGHRYDIIQGQPAQGAPNEQLRPGPKPGPQPGQPGMPSSGEPDLEHGKVAVPATPLATIEHQPTSYERTVSAQDDLNHGRFAEASAGAEMAISLDPKNQRAYALLAVARHSAGEYEKALDAAEQGLKLNPLNQTLLRAKTAATLKKGDYDQAIANADELLKTYATDGLVMVFKAYALGKKGDRDAMLNTLKTAAALDPAYEKVLIEAQNSDPEGGEPFEIPGDRKPKPKAAVVLRKDDPNRQLKIALFLGGVFVFFMICGLLLYSIASYRQRQAEAEAAAGGEAAPETPAETPANSPGPQS